VSPKRILILAVAPLEGQGRPMSRGKILILAAAALAGLVAAAVIYGLLTFVFSSVLEASATVGAESTPFLIYCRCRFSPAG